MQMEINRAQLGELINKQLSNFFGYCPDVYSYLEKTLMRTENCFKMNSNKYYQNGEGEVFFSPFHSGQYSIFLYFLSNTIYHDSNDNKLYRLN